jgi:hypothetical protein
MQMMQKPRKIGILPENTQLTRSISPVPHHAWLCQTGGIESDSDGTKLREG